MERNRKAEKSNILAFLSTRVPIIYSLGVAAQGHVWDFSNPCFDQIKNFRNYSAKTARHK
jgi:hypothetical protein